MDKIPTPVNLTLWAESKTNFFTLPKDDLWVQTKYINNVFIKNL